MTARRLALPLREIRDAAEAMAVGAVSVLESARVFATMEEAIADLGFPTEDGHNYDADQVKAIINQLVLGTL